MEKALIVTIPNTKTHTSRSFTIVADSANYYNICKKYINLRPSGINNTTLRFFLNYQHGRCTRQVVGINKFGNVPKQIAAFLNLPNPELYTGHSIRRSSTTVLADTGANLTEIKQHGGWKSSAVAEQYIEDSINNKIKRGRKIFQSLENASEAANMLETTISFDYQTFDFDNTASNLPIATTSTTKNLPSTSTTEVSTANNNPPTASVNNYYNNCIFHVNAKNN